MHMRVKIAAGNWKMNGSRTQTAALITALRENLAGGHGEVILCPPYVYLSEAAALLDGTGISLGAQDVAVEDSGAFTGEVAGSMLADVGCSHVIVGHSERRALFGEDDAVVAAKFAAAQRNGLVPIFCVGETLEERQSGITEEVVGRQLQAVLDHAGVAALARAVIAYEPVWAIGTGMTATPEQAQAVHAFVRGRIAAEDATIADSVRILYGGSVKSSNAGDLFSMPDVDGGLVGGASLDAQDFAGICRAAG
jgi:triosephosphate isomerase